MDHGPAAATLAGYVGRAAASPAIDPADSSASGPSRPPEREKPGSSDREAQEKLGLCDAAERGQVSSDTATWRMPGGGGPASAVRPWVTAARSLALWCADWPLVAAGVPPYEPAVVLHAGRTVACTSAARAEGVHRGMRRRDAEARCPHLVSSAPRVRARRRAVEVAECARNPIFGAGGCRRCGAIRPAFERYWSSRPGPRYEPRASFHFHLEPGQPREFIYRAPPLRDVASLRPMPSPFGRVDLDDLAVVGKSSPDIARRIDPVDQTHAPSQEHTLIPSYPSWLGSARE